ncbi:cytidylate kinase [Acetitomaculum ruminis DSM 5522]|uniref:Cytidylate kinase n=1 Tax=Acetitomaculum ruminis DSM 5522 TaxID=1120918 RepID=A0A1I0VJX0_9FIRM|nr:(d)CMP kinase [Acetitomaculum ruminis]SFA76313.1 cytidylate kinase [Acetitomaculum ruminis DSM 5522]
MRKNIAIDGPAGAGKSTVAKAIAKKLNMIYVDTGAMYRSIALFMLKEGVDVKDSKKVAEKCEGANVSIEYVNGAQQVILNGENVNGLIRTSDVSMAASYTSKVKEVRDRMTFLQRQLAKEKDLVMDGRDIGTNVLPDAFLKIYLTADVYVRAKRRYEEFKEKGENYSLDDIAKDISKRDEMDKNREISPLKKAEDAIEVNTDNLTPDEVVDYIISLYKEKV